MQDPKVAKQLYVNGLLNDQLRETAIRRIKIIIETHIGWSLTVLVLKTLLDNVKSSDSTKITEIVDQLKNSDSATHQSMRKFVEDVTKKRNPSS